MEGKLRVSSHKDVMLTKLRYKVINHGINVVGGVYKYESDECLQLIVDNLLIYMKSVIRSMVQHKRKFKIVCPLLTRKVGNETQKSAEKSMNKEEKESEMIGNKRLMPWQIKLDLKKMNTKDAEIIEEKDLKDVEENGRENVSILNSMIWKPQSPTHEKCMDIGTEADKCRSSTSREGMGVKWEAKTLRPSVLTSEEDMNVNREISVDADKSENMICQYDIKDNEDNKINNWGRKEVKKSKQVSKDDEREDKSSKKEDKKNTAEYIRSEVVYSKGPFGVRDLIQILMRNPHVIPKRSIHQITVIRALNKLGPKSTGVKI